MLIDRSVGRPVARSAGPRITIFQRFLITSSDARAYPAAMKSSASRSMTLRATVLFGALILTGACGNDGGGTPTGPTPPAPPLISEGPALLDVSSVDIACSAKTPAWGFFGPRAGAAATIVRDGDGWLARGGVPAAGDFELRFRTRRRHDDRGASCRRIARHGDRSDLVLDIPQSEPGHCERRGRGSAGVDHGRRARTARARLVT